MKRFLLCLIFLSLNAIPPENECVVATKLDSLVSLDPADAYEQIGLEFLYNSYDRLVAHAGSGEFTPLIAGEWSVSDEGNIFTFTIKEGIRFISGNPLTAEDCQFSLQRIVVLNRSPAYLFNQFGWNEENVDEMIQVEGNKLVIKTDKPYAPTLLLYCLASNNASIVDKKEVLSQEKSGDMGNGWLKSHHAGSGPFYLDTYLPYESLTLKANPSYFRGESKLNKVVLRHYPEEATRRMLLTTGEVDIGRDLTELNVKGVKNVEVISQPLSMTYFLSMNQKNPYLKHPEVCQAIKYLIDYDGLESITEGKMRVHQSFIPVGFLGALEEKPFKYDAEKAVALLKKVGLDSGFTLTLDCSDINKAQALQAMFAPAKIKLKIIQGDSKQVLTKVRAREHDLALSTWIPDYCDPHSNALTFTYNPDNSDQSNFKTVAWRNHWDTQELNELTLKAAQEKDTEKRKEIYATLQRRCMESAPFAVLFQENGVYVRRKESAKKCVEMVAPQNVLNYYVNK